MEEANSEPTATAALEPAGNPCLSRLELDIESCPTAVGDDSEWLAIAGGGFKAEVVVFMICLATDVMVLVDVG